MMPKTRVGKMFVLALLAATTRAEATQKPPVHWHIKSSPAKPVKPGAKFNVAITGELEPGWHLYALEEPQSGPIATEIALTEGDPADLIRVEEGKPKVILDPAFQVPTGFFEKAADFTLHLQLAKQASYGDQQLRVLLRYQSCNDRVCLPPVTDTVTVPFTVGR